jgi:uncharacterized membrane protein
METTALILCFVVLLLILLAIYWIHSLPGKIAEKRGHPQVDAIKACSLVGLLMFPFWMAAFVWSFIAHPESGKQEEGIQLSGTQAASGNKEKEA